jgi:hypothetical protein
LFATSIFDDIKKVTNSERSRRDPARIAPAAAKLPVRSAPDRELSMTPRCSLKVSPYLMSRKLDWITSIIR